MRIAAVGTSVGRNEVKFYESSQSLEDDKIEGNYKATHSIIDFAGSV